MEPLGALNRIYSMGRIIRVSVAHRRAINKAITFSGHVPLGIGMKPGQLVRGFRSALRMSQAQLARRCGLARTHITHIEAGYVDVQIGTLRRIFDALFCDLLVLPLPRKRPGDVLADRRLEKSPDSRTAEKRIWD